MISVIICTDNRPEHLKDCLESINNQTLIPCEVIIAHTGRKDNTVNLVDSLSRDKDFKPKLKYLDCKVFNSARQRNIGASISEGDILFFIDDDLVCDPSFVERINDVFLEDKACRVAGVSATIINQHYVPLSRVNKAIFDLCLSKKEVDVNYAGKVVGPAVNFLPDSNMSQEKIVDWLPSCCCAYRRGIFMDYKFNERFFCYSFMEDVELSLRIKRRYILINTGKAKCKHKDLGSKTHKDWVAVGKMQVINRWYIMVNILKKDNFINKSRFFYFQLYSLICEFRYLNSSVSFKNTFYRWWGRFIGLCGLNLSDKAVDYSCPRVLLSHSGKQHSYKVALSLQNINMLGFFVTSSYFLPRRFPDILLSKIFFLRRLFEKRHEMGLNPNKVKRFILIEVPEIILRFFMGNSEKTSAAVFVRDTLFDKFVSSIKNRDCNIFWGFQGSCLESLKSANKKNLISIVEFSTGHISSALSILRKEINISPEWADSISNLYFPKWYINRLIEEPFAAKYCFVPSNFAKNSLLDAGVPAEKVFYLPLGVSTDKFIFAEREKSKCLKLLFIGGVGQRKGIKYLLEALKIINSPNIKLNIIGPIFGSGEAFKSYARFYDYRGVKNEKEIIKAMHESDCLILPSLFEGFGLVIPEAMATGMPVIASRNSAGPDIIREGVDGFIINHDDVQGLVEKINLLASSRKLITEMGRAAAERAKNYSWEKHSMRVKEILNKICND